MSDIIVAPACIRHSLLHTYHTKFHHGSAKMFAPLITKYWWPYIRKDIKHYSRACDACQRIKPKNYTYGKTKLFPPSQPFEMVSIDIVGPLPLTNTNYRYMVTMIDRFSHYCMIVPVADIRTITILQAYEDWISIFGPPKYLLSDNGSQFLSNIFRHFTKITGTNQRFTTAYHPQCNGMIERLHRWIKERLALIAYDMGKLIDSDADENDKLDWSVYTNVIQYTYNTTPNQMTKTTPYHIIFGNAPPPRIDEIDENPDLSTEYIDYIARRIAIIRDNVKIAQRAYDTLRKARADKNSKESDFDVGELVLYNISQRYTGNKKKFTPHYVGPYEIIKIFNNGQNVQLREVENELNIFNGHISNVKRYHTFTLDNENYMNPHEILLQQSKNHITKTVVLQNQLLFSTKEGSDIATLQHFIVPKFDEFSQQIKKSYKILQLLQKSENITPPL